MLIKLLRTYLRPYRGQLLLIVALQLIANAASLYLPNLNADIIDNGVAKADTNRIWSSGGLMLAVSFVQIAAQVAAAFFGARTAMRFGRDVRAALFDRVLSFSSREVNTFGAPSLITRNTNDVQQVQMLVFMSAIMMVSAPIMMVGGVFMALQQDVNLAWIIVVMVALLGGVIAVLVSQMTPLFRRQQTRIDTLNRVLREQITGLRVIRAFVREPSEQARFDVANAELADTALRVGIRMQTLFPTVMFVMNLGSIAVLWFGALRVDVGEMQVGQLMAFLQYLMQILMSVMMSTFLFMMGPRAAVCAARIEDVLQTESSVVPPAKPVTDLVKHSELTFDDVSFSYPGAEVPVLSHIDFTVRAGQTTAIVGSTGSGKSTLVSLIPRLFDATSGQVLVDGVNVRDIDADLLWSRIGLVPQKAYLFSGTIASNLRYGKPDATDDELWQALEIAQAADFVRRFPEGLEHELSQGGTNVSGGQRQRLSIARALVKRPEVYVFDDSFSALDVATDARLRAALAPVVEDAAVVIVAQRISTIRDADQIVVLDDGVVEGIGTHEQLLATCPTYAEIVESQFKAEEVAA